MGLLGSGKTLQSIATAAIRAVETYRPADERLYEDRVGLDLLPPIWQAFIRPMRIGPIRQALLSYRERQVPGVIGSLVCRTRFIDDVLTDALADGLEQVVILGAGFDSRPYRIPGIESVAVFEVDHPEAQHAKVDRVRSVFGTVPAQVTFVPIDFDRQSLADELDRAGFDPGQETLFIWEGVTQYITEDAVDATLQLIAGTDGGGTVVFTYVEEDIVEGRDRTPTADAVMAVADSQGSPWITGFDPATIEAFLADRELAVRETAGAAEYRARYPEIRDRPGDIFEGERIVVATNRLDPAAPSL